MEHNLCRKKKLFCLSWISEYQQEILCSFYCTCILDIIMYNLLEVSLHGLQCIFVFGGSRIFFDLLLTLFGKLLHTFCFSMWKSFLCIMLWRQVIYLKQAVAMARRQVGSTRRLVDSGSFPLSGSLHSKTHSSPLLSVALFLLVWFVCPLWFSPSQSYWDSMLIWIHQILFPAIAYLSIFINFTGCSPTYLLCLWLRSVSSHL